MSPLVSLGLDIQAKGGTTIYPQRTGKALNQARERIRTKSCAAETTNGST